MMVLYAMMVALAILVYNDGALYLMHVQYGDSLCMRATLRLCFSKYAIIRTPMVHGSRACFADIVGTYRESLHAG